MSVASTSRTGGISAWEHHRRTSIAPSMASTSEADGLISPGLGMGPIGEFGGVLVGDENPALSPTPLEGRESPKPIFRTSPSGGIAYVLNGVPKNKAVQARAPGRRSVSVERKRQSMRSFSVCVSISDNKVLGADRSPISHKESSLLPSRRLQRMSHTLTQSASRKIRFLLVRRISRQPKQAEGVNPSFLTERKQAHQAIQTVIHSWNIPYPATFHRRCLNPLSHQLRTIRECIGERCCSSPDPGVYRPTRRRWMKP